MPWLLQINEMFFWKQSFKPPDIGSWSHQTRRSTRSSSCTCWPTQCRRQSRKCKPQKKVTIWKMRKINSKWISQVHLWRTRGDGDVDKVSCFSSAHHRFRSCVKKSVICFWSSLPFPTRLEAILDCLHPRCLQYCLTQLPRKAAIRIWSTGILGLKAQFHVLVPS